MKYLPWLVTALLGLLIVGLLMWSPQGSIIGVINMGQIIEGSPKARELNLELSQRYNLLLDEIRTGEEGLDEAAQADRERQVYAEYLRFRQELEEQFQIELDRAIASVANELNINMVVDEDVVRFGGKDITREIIAKLQ